MPKILIIDDEEDICEMLETLFRKEGFETMSAGNGREALKLMEREEFDLMITDIVMPEMEGISTIIETQKEQPDMKIFAISGGGRIDPESYLELASGFGAIRTFTKPLDIRELLDAVRSVLDGDDAGKKDDEPDA